MKLLTLHKESPFFLIRCYAAVEYPPFSELYVLYVHPLGREFPDITVTDPTDCYDANWIETEIEIIAGDFKGKTVATILAEEFQAFRNQLDLFSKGLSTTASFSTIEEWLTIEMTRKGNLLWVECNVLESPMRRNSISFEVSIDQTQIPEFIHGLDRILKAFPVIKGK